MSKVSIRGILYDKKSSFLKGSALAPPLIRKAFHSYSTNYFTEKGIDVNQPDLLIDKGDFNINEYFEIERLTQKHLQENTRIITLGGDHSITFPIIKAYSQFYSDIHILHIDAHSDLYDELQNDPYSHACPFARIMEGNYAEKLIQVGIRTLNTHQKEQAERFNVKIYDMSNLNLDSIADLNKPIYISLDMDAFDPAFAPGVSHHEPGGLTSRQVIDLIHRIKVPLIGADIVEYNPTRDIHDMTAALAGKMMKEILGKMLENPIL